MKNHHLVFRAVDEDRFDELVSGLKTVETRASTLKYQKIQAGDTLTFTCADQTLVKTITKLEHFTSLDELFKHIPLQKVFAHETDVEKCKGIIYGFPGYKEKIANDGILAFHLAD